MEIDEVVELVKKRVVPSEEEKRKVHEFCERLLEKARSEAELLGLEASPRIEGSIAKDTWISGDRDIDLFLFFPEGTPREVWVEKGLLLAKKIAGEQWKEAYAEHPYIEAKIGEFTVDIVPSVWSSSPSAIATSVGRTPYHTNYVNSKLASWQRDEVRVLKQFAKGLGVYGAELKVRGFSGYLCELLIIGYGSFSSLIREAGSWKVKEVLDLERHYKSAKEVRALFRDDVFIVVDPVDKRRNVASPLSRKSFFTFVSASRWFAKYPSLSFFFPPDPPALRKEELKWTVRGSHVLALELSCPDAVPDVLWGQIWKSLNGMKVLLEKGGFSVLDCDAFSDEENVVVLVFELERGELPASKVHRGPLPTREEDERRFLLKRFKAKDYAFGPWISDSGWMVVLRRGEAKAKDYLSRHVLSARLGWMIKEKLEEGFRIYEGEELAELAERYPEFSRFLARFLVKAPPWLLEVAEKIAKGK